MAANPIITLYKTVKSITQPRQYSQPQLLRTIPGSNRQSWQALTTRKNQKGRLRATIIQIDRETPDTVTLEFTIEQRGSFNYKAGQFVTCIFKDPTKADLPGRKNELKRAYSLSGDAQQGALKITVKQISDGLVSTLINQSLSVGDHFEIIGPSGSFVLPEQLDKHYLFIAGGVGITPIYSQITALLEEPADKSITLLYASHDEASIIYKNKLMALATKHQNFHLHFYLSKKAIRKPQYAKNSLPVTWHPRLRSDDISAAMNVSGSQYPTVSLCGPDGLMSMINETLNRINHPPQKRLQERFLVATNRALSLPEKPQQILFKRSRRTLFSKPGQTILDAALDAGLDLPHSCQMGGCGHCKTAVISGNVLLEEPNCLSDEEKSKHLTLACCAYASGPIEIDA